MAHDNAGQGELSSRTRPGNQPKPTPHRIDRTIIELLGQELILLARGIEVTFQPAAERLGCAALVEELVAATTADASGTMRRLAKTIGHCLDAVEEMKTT